MTRKHNEATASPSCKCPSQNMLFFVPLHSPRQAPGLALPVSPLCARTHPPSARPYPTPAQYRARRRLGPALKELSLQVTGTEVISHDLQEMPPQSLLQASFPLESQFPWCSPHLPPFHGWGGGGCGEQAQWKAMPLCLLLTSPGNRGSDVTQRVQGRCSLFTVFPSGSAPHVFRTVS